jgi:Domain of unknown function (DUF6930)
MTGKIVKIETALMARLPQANGEVWEVGRRRLNISIAELERKGERPELLLAVHASGQGGVVQANLAPSSAAPTALADFVLETMRQPMIGKPRRPQLIRVNSQAEAEALAATLAAAGVRLEVSAPLVMLDALVEEMSTELDGGTKDYRTQAARAGESLSEQGLRELYSVARAFYRAELWLDFGDEVIFEIKLQPTNGAPKTLYGIIMGNMGQEFGLALYASLDDFRRFYEFSVQHIEQMEQTGKVMGKGRMTKKRQDQEDEMLAKLMSVSAVGLTFTPQRDVPLPLVEEAKQLRLPIANKSAFPLVMRLGAGGMSVGSISDLRDVHAATRAILDWDQRIDAMDVDDEVGVTITSKLPPVAHFVPALTAHTTLRLNPSAPEAEPALSSELNDFFQVLFEAPPRRTSAPRKKSPQAGGGKTPRSPAKKAPAKPAVRQLPHPSKLHPKPDDK